MNTFPDIISAWPSPSDFAKDLGIERATVSLWKFRERIPSEYWLKVSRAAKRRGLAKVTLERLAAIGAK